MPGIENRMIGETAWAALSDALKDTMPECAGDDRFIADWPSQDDMKAMRRTCRRCPIADLCGAYADAARPPGTYWAGKHYPARVTHK